MAAIARPLQLSSRSNSSQPSARGFNAEAWKTASTLNIKTTKIGKEGKAGGAKKKKSAGKAAKAAKANIENVPPLPVLTHDMLAKTDIYKQIPRPPSTRRVSFRINECRELMALSSIAEEEEEESAPAMDGPDYEAMKTARRQRRAAKNGGVPQPMPTGEERPAGAVARNALLADSLAARMAARRKEKQEARVQAAKVTQALEQGTSLHLRTSETGQPSHLSAADLDKMKEEREKRVQSLLSQLDRLSTGQVAERPRSKTTALTTYQAQPLFGGLQAATLVSLLRGEGARQMAPVARAWLAQEGSAAKVREVIEQAPPGYQAALVAVLSRLLSDETAPEEDVRITVLGCNAMLNDGAKDTNEERPLPRPIASQVKPTEASPVAPPAASSPMEIWEADEDGSFTLRVA